MAGVRSQSLAWTKYLEHLRGVAQILLADPEGTYSRRHSPKGGIPGHYAVRRSAALAKGALVLTCSHLQGYVIDVSQEFLEAIDSSGLDVAQLPLSLRAELCMRFPYPSGTKEERDRVAILHTAYAPLWRDGTPLDPGTIRTDSLTDPSANPWPKAIQRLLGTMGIDYFGFVFDRWGVDRVNGIKTYVLDLVEKRNKIAHGDDGVLVSGADVRNLLQWSTRAARACDASIGARLFALTGSSWTTSAGASGL